MSESNQRKLTTHQKAVLIQVLRVFPDERVSIRYSPSAVDGHVYARDFLSVFRAIGWEVNDPEAAEELTEEPSGLAVIANEAELPPCAEALRDALRIFGVEVQTLCAGTRNVGNGRFVLRVGRGY